ncbi:hypothetical protein P261_02304 [Lachnospiraceae bacterium TWA4]|nr:hypothetical protein P261_02304 [Lachnospiraceae bacterium TWA4]
MSLEFEYIKSIKDEDFQRICNRNNNRGGLYDSLISAEKLLKIVPEQSIVSSGRACEQLVRFIYLAYVKKNFKNVDDKKNVFDMLEDTKFKETLNEMFGSFEGTNVVDTLHKIRKYRNEAAHVSDNLKKEGKVLDQDLNAAAEGVFRSAKDIVNKLLKGMGLVPISRNESIKVVHWKASKHLPQSPTPSKPVQRVSVTPTPSKPAQRPLVQKTPAPSKPVQRPQVQKTPSSNQKKKSSINNSTTNNQKKPKKKKSYNSSLSLIGKKSQLLPCML